MSVVFGLATVIDAGISTSGSVPQTVSSVFNIEGSQHGGGADGPAASVLWASGIWTSQTPLAVRDRALPSPPGNPIRPGRVLGYACGPHQPGRIALPRPLPRSPTFGNIGQISRNRRLRRLNLQIRPDFPNRRSDQRNKPHGKDSGLCQLMTPRSISSDVQ